MSIKKIIRKNLKENHDLIRTDESLELLDKATNSLIDSVRYLEALTQRIDNKDCNQAIIRVLDVLRHPAGNVSSEGGFDEKTKTNILAVLEMLSSIIGLELYEKSNEMGLDQ